MDNIGASCYMPPIFLTKGTDERILLSPFTLEYPFSIACQSMPEGLFYICLVEGSTWSPLPKVTRPPILETHFKDFNKVTKGFSFTKPNNLSVAFCMVWVV